MDDERPSSIVEQDFTMGNPLKAEKKKSKSVKKSTTPVDNVTESPTRQIHQNMGKPNPLASPRVGARGKPKNVDTERDQEFIDERASGSRQSEPNDAHRESTELSEVPPPPRPPAARSAVKRTPVPAVPTMEEPPAPPPRKKTAGRSAQLTVEANNQILNEETKFDDQDNLGVEVKKPPRPAKKARPLSSKQLGSTGAVESDIEMAIPTSPNSRNGKTTGVAASANRNSVRKPVKQAGAVAVVVDDRERFKSRNIIQYGLWAHFMGYGNVAMCICYGIFACLWTKSQTYGCKIGGVWINDIYLVQPGQTTCTASWVTPGGDIKHVCCDPSSTSALSGSLGIGIIYIFYGLFIFFYENTDYGFGLWFPNDSLFFKYRISPIGCLHLAVGVIGLASYSTCFAAACLITNAIVYGYAAYREESGDGGRGHRRKQAAQDQAKKDLIDPADLPTWQKWVEKTINEAFLWNPVTFFRRIYSEDKLSSYFWVSIYVALNVVLFFYTLSLWYATVVALNQGLLTGTLKIDCNTRLCHAVRKVIRYGNLSAYAAWAKACGNCLNMNCSLILLPVIRMLINKLNNSGLSLTAAQQNADTFTKFLARPLTRYIPLSKNIDLHKIIALAIFGFAWGHMIFHFINLIFADAATLSIFRIWRWDGTNWLSGAIVTLAMFVMYSAAPDIVRRTKFEIFFNAHHFFVVFFVFMFLHGPVFIYWSIIPVSLYLLERYVQSQRGNRPFLVCKVEWISPVLAIYFRPVFKEDFVFKEGQYLYMNCPHISKTEWHPFTISSAHDDLHNGPRIHLESGEEVVEVPRPPPNSQIPAGTKWNKYCLVSQDWRTMSPADYLDKSDTGFCDYVSIHIKVHGLEEPAARTWTRKLKEYFELLSPTAKFPMYFNRRDARGEITIGKQFGPDNLPIIRIDGPHSAPNEHYCNYGTVMVIGAGIGLTPCASILCALTKYRWKKNFNPEIIHVYWVVRQNEIDSFQWIVHLLTELSYEFKLSREKGQIEQRYYCEINVYVTGVEKKPVDVRPLHRAKRVFNSNNSCTPSFTADELYAMMLNPPVESKGQVKKMKTAHPKNKLQDIWIWNGRPYWEEIFAEVRMQRQHPDIGVCFCGAPVIGADLRHMCEKYSSIEDDCMFSLHKENF